MNGWTLENGSLRESIITNLDLDVVCLAETHLKEEKTVDCAGFKAFTNNRELTHKRAPKGSGGVAILVKENVLQQYHCNVIDNTIDGILGLEMVNKFTLYKVIVYSCYLSPLNSVWGRDSDSFFNHLTAEIYKNYDADSIFVGGDFNARIGNEKDYVENVDGVNDRVELDSVKCGHGDAMLDFLKETKMMVLNGRMRAESNNFTSTSGKGRAVVDYVAIPHEDIVKMKEFKVILMADIMKTYRLQEMIGDRCKTPDHSILVVTTCSSYYREELENNLNAETYENSAANSKGQKQYDVKSIPESFMANQDWNDACQELIEELLLLTRNQNQIDLLYDKLCEQVGLEMEKHLNIRKTCYGKTRKQFKVSKPYWTAELTEMWKEMNKNEREYVKCKSPYKVVKNALKEKFTSSRRIFDKELRKSARQYNYTKLSDLENIASDNPNMFWNKIKNMGPRKSSKVPLTVKIDDQESSEINEVKQKWKDDFETLLNPKESTEFDNNAYEEAVRVKEALVAEMLNPQYESNAALNHEITVAEISKVIAGLKEKKATGPDSIANEIIKCEGFKNILWQLISFCFHNSIVPSIWKSANIKPIPKGASKDPYVPLNYRGISLISCVSKCFSIFVNNRLTKYCNEHELLAEEQNGFRTNRSCEDHIFVLNSIIENRLNEGKSTYCSFIDLEKAFDWVNRDLLLYRLMDIGIDGKLYFSIENMLNGTQSRVVLDNNVKTAWFNVASGVRQGDPLSPTLFSIFIDDLIKHLKTNCRLLQVGDCQINSLFYADDMVIMAESEKELQTLLDELNSWCHKWQVKINEEKSKIIHFRKVRAKCTEIEFKLNGSTIEKVKSYRYLGIYFDEHLKFDICIKTLAESAGRALGSIISKFKSLKNVGYKSYTKLYKCGVIPIMTYGSSVWGFKKACEIDYVHNRAMRYFLGTHKYTPILGMEGDMGWYKPCLERKIATLRLYNRICLMDDSRLTKCVFLNDVGKCKNNWASRVKLILDEVGYSNQFLLHQTVPLENVSSILKEKYEQDWKNEIIRLPKLRTFRLFKTTFGVESYVKHSLNRQSRSYMAQFRLGILPLNVEVGRYRSVPLEDRKCEFCLNDIEDETHFLMECNLYRSERKKLFEYVTQMSSHFENLTKDEKFLYLMQNNWKETAKFIQTSYDLRTREIYVKNN